MQIVKVKPVSLISKESLFLFLFFVVFTIVILSPVVFHLNDEIWVIFGEPDSYGFFNYYWEWKNFVLHHWKVYTGNPQTPESFYTLVSTLIKYPIKVHIGNYTDFIVTWGMESIFSFPAWYNVRMIILFFLNALSAGYLIYYLSRDKYLACCMGVMFSSSPYFFVNSACNRIEQFLSFGIPMALLYMVKMFKEHRHLNFNAAMMGFFWAISSFSYWYNGMYTGFCLVIYTIYFIFGKKYPLHTKLARIVPWIIACGVMVIIVSPFLYPYMYLKFHGAQVPLYRVVYNQDFDLFSEDYVTQHWSNLTVGESGNLAAYFSLGSALYMSPILTYLFLLSFFYIRRIPFVWYILSVFFLNLSLGPFYKFGHMEPLQNLISRKNVIYHLFYKYVPLFTNLHWPHRILNVVIIMWCVLAAFSVIYFFTQLRIKRKHFKFIYAVLAISFLVFVALEGHIPVRTTPFHIPKIYHKVAREIKETGENIAILELPFNGGDVIHQTELSEDEESLGADFVRFYEDHYYYSDELKLYYQVFSGARIFNQRAAIEGTPPELEVIFTDHKMAKKNTVMQFLFQLSINTEYATPINITEEDIKIFEDAKYKYFILHKNQCYKLVFLKTDFMRESFYNLEKMADKQYELIESRMIQAFGDPIDEDYESLWIKPGGGIENYRYGDIFLRKTPVLTFEFPGKLRENIARMKAEYNAANYSQSNYQPGGNTQGNYQPGDNGQGEDSGKYLLEKKDVTSVPSPSPTPAKVKNF